MVTTQRAWIPDQPLYDIPHTGKLLGGISRVSVYRLINRGKLKLVKLGTSSRITAGSIQAYLDEVEAG